MPKMKVLSGKDLLKIFSSFDFEEIGQRGSHVKIRRLIGKEKQTLTIPLHKEIDHGLLKQIFVQGSQYISEEDLKTFFYN